MDRRIMIALGAAALALGPVRFVRAQQPPDSRPFTPGELDQILAPVALYPDALLAQLLMASTYPVEVSEAAEWSRAHGGLRGDAAVNAVGDQQWDVSVKSMVAFPQVLDTMSRHLDWTQKMGDAELGQPQDVADSIQRLRAEAYAAGNLRSGSQYVVSTAGSGDDVQYVIAPVDQTVIYVPYYDPRWAYGHWRWADNPPYYWAPEARWNYGVVGPTGFFWGLAIATTFAMFGAWEWRRGHSALRVDYDRALRIDRRFERERYADRTWRHDPIHRGGVAYRDAVSRQQYRQVRPGAEQREGYRGRAEPTGNQHEVRNATNQPHANPPAQNNPAHQANPQTQHGSSPASTQAHTAPPGNAAHVNAPTGSPHTNALSGVNHGNQVQQQSNRGQQQQNRVASHAPPAPAPKPAAAPKPVPQTHSSGTSNQSGSHR